MGKRRADADTRRFLDQFEKVRVSRFRALGVVDPSKFQALIPFPNGKVKLLNTTHNKLKYGGGWSFFICPGCANRTSTLYLIDDAPRCRKCCDAMNITYRGRYGLGRDQRRQAADKYLDQLVAKLETNEPLRLKTPECWEGKAKFVYGSHKLANSMRRSMVALRLNQIALQSLSGPNTKSYTPLAATKQLVEVQPIWRARSNERLEQALDKAQAAIINALDSDNPKVRLAAAHLMMRTKQARERGLT